MDCHHMEPKLYAYLQGQVTEKERGLIEEHLKECIQCRSHYLKWRELEQCFAALEVQPPSDFTSQVMKAIKAKLPQKKDNKNYWFAGWYRNVGRGLIAAGILGIFINCSALAVNFSLDKSLEKAFIIVEEITYKYKQFYDISLEDLIRKEKGGINNEM